MMRPHLLVRESDAPKERHYALLGECTRVLDLSRVVADRILAVHNVGVETRLDLGRVQSKIEWKERIDAIIRLGNDAMEQFVTRLNDLVEQSVGQEAVRLLERAAAAATQAKCNGKSLEAEVRAVRSSLQIIQQIDAVFAALQRFLDTILARLPAKFREKTSSVCMNVLRNFVYAHCSQPVREYDVPFAPLPRLCALAVSVRRRDAWKTSDSSVSGSMELPFLTLSNWARPSGPDYLQEATLLASGGQPRSSEPCYAYRYIKNDEVKALEGFPLLFALTYLPQIMDESVVDLQEGGRSQLGTVSDADGYITWVEEQLERERRLLMEGGVVTQGLWDGIVRPELLQSMVLGMAAEIVQHPVAGIEQVLKRGDAAVALLGRLSVILTTANDAESPFPQSGAIPSTHRGLVAILKEVKRLLLTDLHSVFNEFLASWNAAETPDSKTKSEETVATQLCHRRRWWCVTLLQTSFNDNVDIRKTIFGCFRDAFCEFHGRNVIDNLSQAKISTSNIFASHLDLVCRRGVADLASAGCEDRIDDLVALLSWEPSRDVFVDAYRARLARRLLKGSADLELDRRAIGAIKEAYGNTFVADIDRMLTDVEGSIQINDRYREHRSERALEGARDVELDVKVLTASAWPAYKLDTFKAPPVLLEVLRSFEAFYEKKFNGRSLRWAASLGTSVVMVKPRTGQYDVTMSVAQAGVLIMLSVAEGQRLSIDELEKRLGLDAASVRECIAPMYLAVPLLTRRDVAGAELPQSRELPGKDVLGLNAAFASKHRKFPLPAPPRPTRREEGQATDDAIAVRRGAVADAAIVRTMKSRRTMPHSELHEEVLKIISKHFEPTNAVRFIKLRIEDMIAKGYLERSGTAHDTYLYVA